MKLNKSVAVVVMTMLAFAISTAGAANAEHYTTLTLRTMNADIRTMSDGNIYLSLFPSSQTFAGVPFSLQVDNAGNDVFAGVGQLVINVGVFGVTDVYTLINTAYGTANANVGSITFNGSAGASYTVQLIEGNNVRDHYFGRYVNSTSASYVTQAVFGTNVAGRAHLDMQHFVLPAAFQSQNLANIVFNSTGGNSGNPFLVAATVKDNAATYFNVTAIPDVNGDGKVDNALLGESHGNVYLLIIDGVKGGVLKQVTLGSTVELTPISLTVVDDANANGFKDIAVLYVKPDGRSALQLRDSLTGALVKTMNIPMIR